MPLFKSSQKSLWPILAKIVNVQSIDVFLIGCYLGNKKPNDVDSYLHDFMYELAQLKENGLDFNGKNISVEVRGFICDTPARAFV